MSSPSPPSAHRLTVPDTPGSDPMETYTTKNMLSQDTAHYHPEQEKEDNLLDVNVNVDDAAVLTEAESAMLEPMGKLEGDKGNNKGGSLAARVHAAATAEPDHEAVLRVTPEEAERVQEAESRVVDVKESAGVCERDAKIPAELQNFP